MLVRKKIIIYFVIFIILSIFTCFRFWGGHVGDFIVTNYDELRYLFASDKIIQDVQTQGVLFTLENFYNYSQSIHFLHYFVLSFFRYIFNDSMILWSMWQLVIYTVGCYYFSKFIRLEYDFISSNEEIISGILMLSYPVFYFLTFSLMRDIAIFTFLSMSLYFYKSNNYKFLLLFVLILSLYRINMMICVLVYIVVDQLKGKSFSSIMKYLFFSIFVLYIIDIVTINFISRHVSRIFDFNFLNIFQEILVFLFSPLPFSVDQSLPIYLHIWFVFSFGICLFLLFFYFIFVIKTKNIQLILRFPIICMTLVYIASYSLEFGIGFRQSSIVLPFIYIPIFIYFFKFLFSVKSANCIEVDK
ncbi:hypothetical protein RFI02_16740 [Acinetobacter sichuanensis]|uniref:hypothetical protein n=1 Tax=Acinetobacter sichuanensis TaxID=2136183 RepID=UPI0028101A67|nr:hypothetical protein [Acinetobacter sichuanensis]MDQ9022755.1 hypothetical protein [Acinetobacter sichuanensis]